LTTGSGIVDFLHRRCGELSLLCGEETPVPT